LTAATRRNECSAAANAAARANIAAPLQHAAQCPKIRSACGAAPQIDVCIARWSGVAKAFVTAQSADGHAAAAAANAKAICVRASCMCIVVSSGVGSCVAAAHL